MTAWPVPVEFRLFPKGQKENHPNKLTWAEFISKQSSPPTEPKTFSLWTTETFSLAPIPNSQLFFIRHSLSYFTSSACRSHNRHNKFPRPAISSEIIEQKGSAVLYFVEVIKSPRGPCEAGDLQPSPMLVCMQSLINMLHYLQFTSCTMFLESGGDAPSDWGDPPEDESTQSH